MSILVFLINGVVIEDFMKVNIYIMAGIQCTVTVVTAPYTV